MLRLTKKRRPTVWKGLVAGLAGGLVGTIVMGQFQNAWQKAAKALEDGKNEGLSSGSDKKSDKKKNQHEKEDATMKVAGKLASVAGYELSHEQKKKAGPAVHYGFGTSMGALYGVLHEFAPDSIREMHPAFAGLGYGSALFIGADEIAVPAPGLSGSPEETPVSAHIYGFASHLVYGLTGEVVRRTVRHYL